MPREIITDAAYNAIRDNAVQPFKSDSRKLADGSWSIPISDDVLDRLREHRLPNETLSDTILRVVSHSPGIMFGSGKRTAPTVIDAFYRSSFSREAGGGWVNNAVWRKAFIEARRFVLDDEMSTFLGELCTLAFAKRDLSKPAVQQMIEHLRIGARLPFPTTWVEYNLRNSMTRSQELLGAKFDPAQAPAREGWLLQQHPTLPNAIRAHILSYDPKAPDEHGFDAWTFPVAFAWTVDDETVLPWKSLPFDETANTASEVATGITGYRTKRASVVFSDMVRAPNEPETIAELLKEWAGCMRRMWALLSTIDDLPLKQTEVRPSKGFVARSEYRRYLHHRTITLTVPQSKHRKVARTVLALAHRRAHGVRGHWRKDWRRPLAPTCDHIFTASEKHLTCNLCKGRKLWVDAHQRGDAGKGLTTHDYAVKHGDEAAS